MSQPRALFYLSFTELWERFGFYIIQGLLVLFLTQYFSYSDKQAYALLGEFMALVYISPILGGYIADQLLGIRLAVLLGVVFLCGGYFTLSSLDHYWFRVGLAFIVTGNGLLKPNISSFLGLFYGEGDDRRESGYTIFYMGINIGIVISTLTSGWIAKKLGWSVVFSLAGIGMIIALFVFLIGYQYYLDHGLAIQIKTIPSRISKFLANRWVLCLIVISSTIVFYIMLTDEGFANYMQIFLGVMVVVLFVYGAFHYQKQERHNLIILGLLLLVSVFFWALYFQMFFALTLFINRAVDRYVFGIQIPTVAFSSFEPFFVVTLGVFFSWLWQRISEHKHNPSYMIKFGLSMFSICISMLLLMLAIHLSAANALIDPVWIMLIYFFVTLGEMLLYPIGLAMVTVLAPKQLTGIMMGVWFMSLGFGGMFAGKLAQLADVPKHISNLAVIKQIYSHAFSIYALIAVITACAVVLIYHILKKLGIRSAEVIESI